MLQLIFPNKTHKNAYEKLIKEWWESEIIPTSPSVLFHWKNFEEFLENVNKELWEMPWKVPAHLFFLIDDEKEFEILWAIQVRHHINHPNLIEVWWHIWYGIAPKFRWKWYWSKMLSLALKEAKKIWLEKVFLWCDVANIWSNKVIQNNGWIFDKKIKNWEGNRYYINL